MMYKLLFLSRMKRHLYMDELNERSYASVLERE